MNFIKALFLVLFVCAVPVLAEPGDIVKCIEPDGRVVYTNTGCESGKAEAVVLQPITIIESPKADFSFLKDRHFSAMTWVLFLYVLMSVICFLVYWVD